MKRFLYISIFPLILVCVMMLASCSSDEPDDIKLTERTVVVFMPWTGNSGNLISFFKTNIADMKAALEQYGNKRTDRIVVYMAESATNSRMFELVLENGKCEEKPIKTYSGIDVTTPVGITSVLGDVADYAPAKKFAMIVGGHGMGWVRTATYARSSAKLHALMRMKGEDYVPLTRFFGGYTDGTMIDISDFAQGIRNAGIKMEYILFDDCYMSNVEVAFDLKDATDYLIACPVEMMNYGMPYRNILKYLMGTLDYSAVCSELISFYNSYTYGGKKYPYATIAVTDCSQLDAIASLMRQINDAADVEADADGVQVFDGYSPSLFYDLGDYVRHICHDETLLAAFRQQMAAAVPYKDNTPYYFTSLVGVNGAVRKITEFSGLTVSDPSLNPYANDKRTTAWWKATHKTEHKNMINRN